MSIVGGILEVQTLALTHRAVALVIPEIAGGLFPVPETLGTGRVKMVKLLTSKANKLGKRIFPRYILGELMVKNTIMAQLHYKISM